MATILKEVDAVVIGVGWTGSIMARELTKAGLNVVGLERGAKRMPRDMALTLTELKPEPRPANAGAAGVAKAVEAEAKRIAMPAWETQQEFRAAMRKRVYAEQGLMLKEEKTTPARDQQQHSILCGSPDTVAEAIADIDKIGVGGLILVFRLGPMPYEVAAHSIELFMKKVAPEFQKKA